MAHQVFHQFDVIAPDRGSEEFFAGGHPVPVAFDGVDFAVVAHHPEGLTERPCREGIGRKALVVEGNGDFVVRILEIAIKCAQRRWHRQSFVGKQAAGKRRDVKAVNLFRPVFDLPAAKVELALEKIGIHAFRAEHQEVLDVRAGRDRDFS